MEGKERRGQHSSGSSYLVGWLVVAVLIWLVGLVGWFVWLVWLVGLVGWFGWLLPLKQVIRGSVEWRAKKEEASSGSSYLSPLRKQFPPTTTLQMLPRSSVIQ